MARMASNKVDDTIGEVSSRDRQGMRTGYTTGSTAAAAAKAATLALLSGKPVEDVTVWLPVKQTAEFKPLNWQIGPDRVSCAVVKDGGDDPDATHGALIYATVEWDSHTPGLTIGGGEGVGTVTRLGLGPGLEPGGPAINPVPRKMLNYSVREALETGKLAPDLDQWLAKQGLKVSISVPGGAEIARKTLNPRLGILEGISILGTTGIVRPYSTSAWRASVIQAIGVAAANGCREVILATGGRSEKYAMKLRPDLPEVAFVEMGIFTGAALKQSLRHGMSRAGLCGMIGKFSKLAQGHFQTHVAGNQVDLVFLAEIAGRCGASREVQEAIQGANTARHFADIAEAHNLQPVFQLISELVAEQSYRYVEGAMEIEAIMVDFDGRVLGRATSHGR